ncbi:MAG: hypothetical protein RL375_3848 [Pseudomonadota bacterium]|jgi:hypothetical protein
MQFTTHSARITGPVAYLADGGKMHHIPLGPCLLERTGEGLIDVIWGAQGQSSAALPLTVVKSAHEEGHLLLLD